jgi:hypothetical protein
VAWSCPQFPLCRPNNAHATTQEFRALLPQIADKVINTNRGLAIRLAQDPASVAARLVALRVMFPDSNVLRMVDRRYGRACHIDDDALAPISMLHAW